MPLRFGGMLISGMLHKISLPLLSLALPAVPLHSLLPMLLVLRIF